ncbi:hypothetical protein NO263_15175 [Gluconacetobacter entanii]|uniref:Uncharacterized protein n=1 Tax=Gluconacetobacter entanii TaxID=108528 RepID=A0ABT3K948_9PROT|nr:hypothetical protein [Gluconacetobacter entanii]MCW4591923.1 hypothetical protein [Gluconacetobacter entanii]MCW4593812.1 hypothetical protein [Gluconacetobacter entanii]NPC89990.1 hypothetical protein [Gluconacetobacter entanii]
MADDGMTPQPGGFGNILRGMLLLGRGRVAGLAYFGNTRDAVLTALAPRIALWLVGGLLTMAHAPDATSVTRWLFSLCMILLPAVVTYALAQRWHRSGLWCRYIAAAWWTDWLSPFVMLAVALLMALGSPALLETTYGGLIINGVGFAYSLWMTWFIARVGLALGGGRAMLMVGAVLVSLTLLAVITALLPPHYMPWHDFMALPGASSGTSH